MGRIAVLGEETSVGAFGLVGALVLPADDDRAVLAAWAGLPGDVDVVVLTAGAARALGPARTGRPRPLTTVLPEGPP